MDGSKFPLATIGYHGGQITADVYWHNAIGIWGSINDRPPNREEKGAGRFWNAFGVEDPNQHAQNLSITCEINPSHSSGNRQVAGFFGKEDGGKLSLLQKGKLGGSKPGLTMDFFWRRYRGNRITIDGRPYAVIADIESSDLVRDVARFVKESERIKSLLPPTGGA